MGFMYIQLDQKLLKRCDDTFITKIAHNVEEEAALIEAGFEYVTAENSDQGKNCSVNMTIAILPLLAGPVQSGRGEVLALGRGCLPRNPLF
jgi:hypothetical protein